MATGRIGIEVHLQEGDLQRAMRREVRDGLTRRPKQLPPKYFYDERGSWLFERITELDEYYLTRAERRLLDDSSAEIVRVSEPAELLELGAGAASKSRLLLEAGHAHGSLRRYVPVDVSTAMAEHVTQQLGGEYPWLEIHAVVADFERHLEQIPPGKDRLVAFLGSTIGNQERSEAADFLGGVAGLLDGHGYLLLGTDLVKDPAVLEAAYNDRDGITADFNRNVLRVINDQLDANFEPEAFRHVAFYNDELQRIEMHLESTWEQTARVEALDLDVAFEAGERMRTEVSCKYTRNSVESLLDNAGLALRHWFTDEDETFALSLSRRRA